MQLNITVSSIIEETWGDGRETNPDWEDQKGFLGREPMCKDSGMSRNCVWSGVMVRDGTGTCTGVFHAVLKGIVYIQGTKGSHRRLMWQRYLFRYAFHGHSADGIVNTD